MTHLRLLPLVWILWAVYFADVTSNMTTANKPPALKNTSSISNVTEGSQKHAVDFNLDGAMINRALYVLIGITVIGVLYFLVRAVR